MNLSTTTATSANKTTTFDLELLYPYFQNSPTVIKLYSYGWSVTFVLGLLGNIASLFTFSRPILWKVSTGCLFFTLAISDIIFLITSVFDFVEFGLQISLYHSLDYNALCRYRWFVTSTSQLCSAWILVIISIDRWIRTRFPFKAIALCTSKRVLTSVVIVVIISIGLNSHFLLPIFGMLIPGYTILACTPNLYNASYVNFYYLTWNVIQILAVCVIPVSLMLATVVDIFASVRVRRQVVNQNFENSVKRDRSLQKQMLLLMLTSVGVFLITTLPLATYRIITPRRMITYTTILRSADIFTGFTWLQSFNYAVNFYCHCLSSKLFRGQFIEQIRVVCNRGRQTRIAPVNLIETAQRVQTQPQ